jgi:hypothetical protein
MSDINKKEWAAVKAVNKNYSPIFYRESAIVNQFLWQIN